MTEETQNQANVASIPAEMRAAWEVTLKIIEKLIRPQYFQSFILTIDLMEAKDDTLILGFPEKFYRDWVHDHYSSLIQEKFDEACEKKFKLEFSSTKAENIRTKAIMPPLSRPTPKAAIKKNSIITAKDSSLSQSRPLNSKYGFETFVVGSSNQFAHAASFTVAEAPGSHYNPLFIYGEVGLGKTHLLNAIALKVIEKFENQRVHYTTFEKFTNHMIESIRFEKMDEFRERYRKHCDVLIIDDIQFISGKERTQEEFFHTFNHLYEHQKQIVISADRTPREIEGLEDRLRSRFEMGLIVDIQPPEMETRVAIVNKKAESGEIQLGQDVAFYLADMYRSNIRELEGALIKLSAYASLTGQLMSVDLAREVLKPDSPEAIRAHQDPEEIMRTVARYFKLTVGELRSAKKNRELAMPRQLSMYLCRKYSTLSLPDLGTLFGGRNHTTVLHAIRRIDKLQSQDPMLKESVMKLERQIREDSAQAAL